jgi:mRNA interferase RelE/StbE
MYNLLYSRSAAKDIKKLPAEIKLRLKVKLEALSESPIKLSKKLVNHPAQYRYRIGDYRVLFDIEEQNIIILKIRNRREVYRR